MPILGLLPGSWLAVELFFAETVRTLFIICFVVENSLPEAAIHTS
jgi:hypothetical protein